MPRLKTGKPKDDPLKAIILQRKNALKMPTEELAKGMGISRQKMSMMLNGKSTDEWKLREIKQACKMLWITADEMRAAIKN